MSKDLEGVLAASKKLESLLMYLGAQGRGLHEKCTSVEHVLPADIVWAIRFVATSRNKLLHEDGYVLRDVGAFQYQASSAIAYLEKASSPELEPPVARGGGITVQIPDRIFHQIPLAELEWFSKQDLIFDWPPKAKDSDTED